MQGPFRYFNADICKLCIICDRFTIFYSSFIADVMNIESFEKFGSEVKSAVGDDGLNVLINNAGILRRRSNLQEVTPDDYLDTLKTNLLGPIFLTKVGK